MSIFTLKNDYDDEEEVEEKKSSHFRTKRIVVFAKHMRGAFPSIRLQVIVVYITLTC